MYTRIHIICAHIIHTHIMSRTTQVSGHTHTHERERERVREIEREMNVNVFDSKGVRYAVLNQVTNRIQIWSTEKGTVLGELHDSDDLAVRYTSFKFGRRVGKDELVVGTNQGEVQIWDLVKNEILVRINVSPTKRDVDVVDLDTFGDSLYACLSDDPEIKMYRLEQDEYKATQQVIRDGADSVRRICVSANGQYLLAASTNITVWDVSGAQPRKIKTVSGHAVPVTCLSFAHGNDGYFVSAAADRFVSVWTTQNEDEEEDDKDSSSGKKKKRSRHNKRSDIAIQSFSLTSVPKSLSFRQVKNNLFRLACSGESGTVSIWNQTIDSKTKSAPRSADGVVESNDASCVALLKSSVWIARAGARNTFYAFSKVKCEPVLKKTVTLKDLPKVALAQSHKKDRSEVTQAAVRQDGNNEHVLDLKESIASKAQSRLLQGEENGDVVDTRTFEERIAAWQAQMSKSSTKKRRRSLDDSTSRKTKRKHETGAAAASSLGTLLDQALKSNDRAMLEHCLEVQDTEVIDATVRRLPVNRVLPFFHAVVKRLEKRPTRGSSLSAWLRAVLIQHAGYLAAVPDLSNHLSSLSRLIEMRVALFPKFLQLNGRLQLLLAQSGGGDNSSSAGLVSSSSQQGAVMVIRDDEEGDSSSNDDDNDDDDE